MEEPTIVIPTYNRSAKLIETLDALLLLTYKNFRVVVIDDGSTDNTAQIVAAKKKQLPFPVDFYTQPNSGASAATNNGVAKAGKGLIILLDDDILPEPGMVSDHLAFHRDHPQSILSGSAETDPHRSVTDVQRYKLFMETEWKRIRPSNGLKKIDFNDFMITTANMSFPFEVFQKVGGFDISLRDGYDVDFGFRALLKNIPLYYDARVRSIHNDQISLRYYSKRQKAYTDSKKIIFDRNPELRDKIGREIIPQVSFLKSIAYSILSLPLVVSFFESGFFVKIFPKQFRYRIYGSTIAALSLKR